VQNKVSIQEKGTFWLVKGGDVAIQAHYHESHHHEGRKSLNKLAIGGPFLKNKSLIIGTEGESITFNGEEILSAGGSGVFTSRLITAVSSFESHRVKDGTVGAGIDFKLPLGIEITVNRQHDSLAVEIRMPPLKGGQDGHCGNFNGDASDDVEQVLLDRIIKLPRADSFFKQSKQWQ